MPCYHPLQAWRSRERTASGKLGITFNVAHGYKDMPLELPCGQCIGCRLERSRQWAMRCMYENQLHQDSCFVTLTYNDDFLPPDGGLRKSDFQRFVKRLRKRFSGSSIRYFHCGEYGESLGRPHYHALLFGVDFSDKKLFKDGDSPLYTSDLLASLWPFGHSTVGAVTFESAAYVARYVMKKVTGDRGARHYERVNVETGEIVSIQPEYITMSLKPAIGRDWFEKFSSDVFPSDFLIVNGNKVKPPKYFDKLLEQREPLLLEAIKLRRIKKASKFKLDFTPSRLKVREQVQSAQLSQLKRHKEF